MKMGEQVQSNGSVTTTNNVKNGMKKPLPEKVFEARNSLLTDLFESNPHINTIRHIFYALLICLLVNTALHDFYIVNELKVGMHLFYRSFGKFHIVLFIWWIYHVSCSMVFLSFNVWASYRISFTSKSNNSKVWDTLWFILVVVYYFLSFRIPPLLISFFSLPQASSAVILAEQVRLLMKQYAFIRENAKKVLSYKPHSDCEYRAPKYGQFMYFLFAPTIVYRDEYPRTQKIHWDYAFMWFVECIATLLCYCFVLLRFINPYFEDFGLRKFSKHEILLAVFNCAIPSMFMLILIFYLVLHCIQNFFAEILRFGDRLFYKDWWSCCSYQEYFRTWNIVVHDWLYTYIYKDVYEVLAVGNKNLAKLVVFVVSALVHEYLMLNTLQFFFPVMFIQFFLGALISFIRTPKSSVRNILFWYGLATGSGIMVSMYTLEFYARYNLPKEHNSWKDHLLPKWLMCDCIQ